MRSVLCALITLLLDNKYRKTLFIILEGNSPNPRREVFLNLNNEIPVYLSWADNLQTLIPACIPDHDLKT